MLFASDAQSSFGLSRNAHGYLRDARRDSSLYNIQVHVLIKSIVNYYFFFASTLFFVNDAKLNYSYMYVWLLNNSFVLYIMFGTISDSPLCLWLFRT